MHGRVEEDSARCQSAVVADGNDVGFGAGVVPVTPAGDVWVLADRVRVEQMLGNFVSNALKYGSPPVTISAVAQHGEAVVRVADRGPGVPEDFRPRLFQQFSRAHGLRASGTGLGLYVVDSLAQAQDGRAWYEPNPGGGSCFCFSLPLADAQSGAGSRVG